MNVRDIVPAVEQHTGFELYSLNRIRDCAGCYILTNASGEILYVGQAVSVRSRLVTHFDSDKRPALTVHGRISLAWWRTADATKLNALERGWLEAIRLRDGQLPPLNRMSAPI